MLKLKYLAGALALMLGVLATVPAAADDRDKKRDRTLIGAGIGMLGGAILSNGDPWATVAGAAAGGVIGNMSARDDDRRNDRPPHYDPRGRQYDERGRHFDDRRDDRRGYDRHGGHDRRDRDGRHDPRYDRR